MAEPLNVYDIVVEYLDVTVKMVIEIREEPAHEKELIVHIERLLIARPIPTALTVPIAERDNCEVMVST